MDLLTLQTSWQSVCKHTDLMLAFGGLPLFNSQISNGGTGAHIQKTAVLKAASAGLRIVNLSPRRSDIKNEIEEQWIKVRPNTDVAFILGMAHTLLAEKLYDAAFLDRFTVGSEKFCDYLLGRKDGMKTATWAAGITGIAGPQYRHWPVKLSKAHHHIGQLVFDSQQHSEQPFWAAIALAAMLSQMGTPGGGVASGYTVTNYLRNNVKKMPYESLPQGKNAVSDFIPVARISDMLLGPGKSFTTMVENIFIQTLI